MSKSKTKKNQFYGSKKFKIIGGILIALTTIALVLVGMGTNNNNIAANNTLRHHHTVRVKRMHVDSQKVFKYRAQLSALSDEHMLYIIHHPKLKNHPQYIRLTKNMMKTTDEDNAKIDKLQEDEKINRSHLAGDHSHSTVTNATQPHKGHPFKIMKIYTGAMSILFIAICIELIIFLPK